MFDYTAPVIVECDHCEGQGEIVLSENHGRNAVEPYSTVSCGFCGGRGIREIVVEPVTETHHVPLLDLLPPLPVPAQHTANPWAV